MKQKDIALIAVIIIISAGISILVSDMIFGTPANRQIESEKVQAISSSFGTPDKKYFNENSIDLTQLITIDAYNNNAPFTGDAQ